MIWLENTSLTDILSLIECNNEEIKQENSNKNPTVNSVQRDYMAGEVSKDVTKRLLLPKEIVDAHEEGIIHFHDADYFEKQDEETGTLTEWIIPNAQKNEMEPIRITLKPGGRTRTEDPHEGELFGYVLSGNITIHIGQQTHRARKGESFYFRPTARHYIEATAKSGASFIWVSTPPSF